MMNLATLLEINNRNEIANIILNLAPSEVDNILSDIYKRSEDHPTIDFIYQVIDEDYNTLGIIEEDEFYNEQLAQNFS